VTTPLSEMICHKWASTSYDQFAYQIRSFNLCSLRRHEKGQKTGWYRVLRV